MLQIDHIYEFLSESVFKDFTIFTLPKGVPQIKQHLRREDMYIFNSDNVSKKIFFWDQEPVTQPIVNQYYDQIFKQEHTDKIPTAFVTSEKSQETDDFVNKNNLNNLYYFFHGFAALDWYRGFYALNYNKPIVRKQKDFIAFNRIISEDRSYRIYFVSQLIKHNLLDKGLVSFGVENDNDTHWQWREEVENNQKTKLDDYAKSEILKFLPDIPERLIIDESSVLGSSSANIIRSAWNFDIDAFWHIVPETVFYYNKLHLTEKIFKPIASKQPFMLLSAPGNLAYLRSYGFKTFDNVINEMYDTIEDNNLRIDSVIQQINWYSKLNDVEKLEIQKELEPIIEHNFHHFYGEFKNIIVNELLTNCKNLFEEIDYKETVDYDTIRKLLLN